MSRATFCGRPGTDSSSSRLAARKRSGEPKCCRMMPLARRADARQLVEHRARHRLVAPAAVELDREAVRLVAGALEQLQLGRVVGQPQRRLHARLEHLLDPLGEADHGHAQVAERAQLLQPGGQLAAAAVDHDQRRQRGEALVVLLVVRDCARAGRRTAPSAVRAPLPWPRSHLERLPGCRSGGSPTSSARRPRTRPSTRPCARASGWRCRSTRSASGSRPSSGRAGAGRAPRCAASGGARSAAGPGRARAARCARPARGCGACRRARRGAPRPARRGARRAPRASVPVCATARGTITCGGTAIALA